MKLKGILFFAIVALLAGTVVFIPARLLETPLNARIAALGQLREARGTIWSGSGVLSLGSGTNRKARVPLTWQFAPSALTRMRLGFDVHAQSDTINGTARAAIGFASVELRDADVSVDATLVSAFNNLAAFAGPRGLLKLTTNAGQSVNIGYSAPVAASGAMMARAENLAVRTIFPKPIGTYDIAITFRDHVAEYTLRDAAGLLKFDGGGQVHWAPTREFAYAGLAAPSRDAPLLLAALLPFGRPTVDGKVRIDYKTTW
jgi:Type II secretion system (T2SS), protein N